MVLLSPYPGKVKTETGPSKSANNDGMIRLRPRNSQSDVGLRPVVMLHGRAANYLQFAPGWGGGDVATAMAEVGCLVSSIDMGGVSLWYNSVAIGAIDAEVNALLALTGATKCDVVGWSMGGGSTLSYGLLHAAKVRTMQVFAPATDLVYFHDTSVNKTTFGPEIETGHGTAGNTAATWLNNSAPYEPKRQAATLAALCGAIPTRILHGDADTVVPITQTQALLAAMGGTPAAWSFETIPGGDHVSIVATADYTKFVSHILNH